MPGEAMVQRQVLRWRRNSRGSHSEPGPLQLERGGQWDKGKSCATFNPLGPWLVTADEIPDPQRLQMFLDVNGQRMQNENTLDMIFSVSYLIWYVSQFMVLEPGDIINTGTPSGASKA